MPWSGWITYGTRYVTPQITTGINGQNQIGEHQFDSGLVSGSSASTMWNTVKANFSSNNLAGNGSTATLGTGPSNHWVGSVTGDVGEVGYYAMTYPNPLAITDMATYMIHYGSGSIWGENGSAGDGIVQRHSQQFRQISYAQPALIDPTSPSLFPTLATKVKGVDYGVIPGSSTDFVQFEDTTRTLISWRYSPLVTFDAYQNFIKVLTSPPTPQRKYTADFYTAAASLSATLATVTEAEFTNWVTANNALPNVALGTNVDTLTSALTMDSSTENKTPVYDPFPVGVATSFGYHWRMPFPADFASHIFNNPDLVTGNAWGGLNTSVYLTEQSKTPGVISQATSVADIASLYGMYAKVQFPRYRYWIPENTLITNLYGSTGESRAFYEETR